MNFLGVTITRTKAMSSVGGAWRNAGRTIVAHRNI